MWTVREAIGAASVLAGVVVLAGISHQPTKHGRRLERERIAVQTAADHLTHDQIAGAWMQARLGASRKPSGSATWRPTTRMTPSSSPSPDAPAVASTSSAGRKETPSNGEPAERRRSRREENVRSRRAVGRTVLHRPTRYGSRAARSEWTFVRGARG
jgi:hypothetical protein